MCCVQSGIKIWFVVLVWWSVEQQLVSHCQLDFLIVSSRRSQKGRIVIVGADRSWKYCLNPINDCYS